jgi:uncharacterized protein
LFKNWAVKWVRTARGLIIGSIAGLIPGTYAAIYNGTRTFIDSFSFALELEDTGVTDRCLMAGATETDFFKRADMADTKIGHKTRMIQPQWPRQASTRRRAAKET